jgi:hypothetical protein
LVHFREEPHQLHHGTDVHRIPRIHHEIQRRFGGVQGLDHGAEGIHIVLFLNLGAVETSETDLFSKSVQHYFQFGMTRKSELLQGNVDVRQVTELQKPLWGSRGRIQAGLGVQVISKKEM